MISDTGICHAIFDAWYLTPVLAMLYLTYDTWHQYLPCYIWHMIPDTGTCHTIFDPWDPTPVLVMLYLTQIPDTGTCHAILITWYLTPILAMLYLTYDTRHRYLPCYIWHVILETWHLYYLAYAWLLYYYQTSGTPVSPVLLNSCTPVSPVLILMLIAQSFRRPAEHAWCRDDEDVSHDRASVWRFLKGTKCHTEQSATPHTWWGPPLESVGATS